MNFLKMNTGKWMTQRTTYIPRQELIYLHQSEMLMNINHDLSFDKTKNNYKTDIISSYSIKNKIDKEVIYLLQDLHQFYFKHLQYNTTSISSNYINKINHISVKTISGYLNSVETLWLVNPNLRLGLNIIKKYNHCVAITFSSDIKVI